jgi:hypothetical protein
MFTSIKQAWKVVKLNYAAYQAFEDRLAERWRSNRVREYVALCFVWLGSLFVLLQIRQLQLGTAREMIAIGFFFVLCVLCTVLAQHRRRARLMDRRLDEGLCPHCGYDLRASAYRCPECGAVVIPFGDNRQKLE